MLRHVLLVAVIALTVAEYHETYFTPGRQYVYKYETQIVSGVPEQSRTLSVAKIKCDVRVHLKTKAQFTVKLENIEIARLTGRLEEVDPINTQVPIELLEPLNSQDLNIMKAPLQQKFKFTYNKGNLVDFFVDPKEPSWSQNLKRGVAYMFQVNLDKTKSIDESETSWSSRSFMESKENSYRVMETSPSGECESLYEVHNLDDQSSYWRKQPLFQVTKVRNYKNCIDSPVFFVSSVPGRKCTDCKPDTVNPLEFSSHSRIALSGDRQRFAIQSVVQESKYIFNQEGNYKTSPMTIVNQTLELIKTETEMLSEPMNVVRTRLIASVPELDKSYKELEKREEEYEQTSSVSSKKISKVKQTLLVLSSQLQAELLEVTSKTPFYINWVVDLLRNMTKTEISRLYDQISRPSTFSQSAVNERFVRLTLLRLLPISATPAAINVLVNKLKQESIRIPEAVEILSTASLHVFSPPAIEKLMELETSQHLMRSPVFKRTFYLTLGSCVHKMNKTLGMKEFYLRDGLHKLEKLTHLSLNNNLLQTKLHLKSKLRILETSRKQIESMYINVIEKLLRSSEEKNRLTAIKSLGNSGLRKAITLLKPLILSQTTPKLLRISAIYALEKIAKVHPYTVTEICLPVYLDQKLPEELRIAAYQVITSTEPQSYIWQVLAQSLKNETNEQVGSYVYRYLMAYSNSTYPCFQARAKNATEALNWVKPHDDPASRVLHFPFYSREHKFGYSVDIRTLGSRHSPLPKSASIKLHTNVLGSNIDSIEAGYSSEGLENIMDTLSKRSEMFKTPSENSYLKKLKESLKIRSRYMESEKKSLMYMKLLGNDMFFYELEPENLLSLITKDTVTLNRASPMTGVQVTFVTPTECGLPLSASARTTYVAKLKGQLQSNVADMMTTSQLYASIEAKPAVTVGMEAWMIVDATVFMTGVDASNIFAADNLHLKAKLSLNTVDMKFKSSLELPQKEGIIAHYDSKVEPFFYMHPIYSADFYARVEYSTIVSSDNIRMKPVKLVLPLKYLGAKVTIVGESPVCRTCMSPLNTFSTLGRTTLRVKYDPKNRDQKLEFTAHLITSEKSFTPSLEREEVREFDELSETPLSVDRLVSRLQPEHLPESRKIGVMATLMRVQSGQRTPLLQVTELCQLTSKQYRKIRCDTLLTRAPWFPSETQTWKAVVKTEVEIPKEYIKFDELLTPTYQQQIRANIMRTVPQDGLRDTTLEFIKSQRVAMWQRWAKNFTYNERTMLHEYLPLVLSDEEPSYRSPSTLRVLQLIEHVLFQQANVSSLLVYLRSAALEHSRPYSYSPYDSYKQNIIEAVKDTLRSINMKLTELRSKISVLSELKNDKYTLLRITSKLHVAIKQGKHLLRKEKMISLRSLKSVYPIMEEIKRETEIQRSLLDQIESTVQSYKEQTWYKTSSSLEEQVLKRHSQIEQILSEDSFLKDNMRVIKKQIEVAKLLHTFLRQSRKVDLPVSLVTRKLQEILTLHENIEQDIYRSIAPLMKYKEPLTYEVVRTIPFHILRHCAKGLNVLPMQEMILTDLQQVIMLLYFRAEPPTMDVVTYVRKVEEKLYKTLDFTSRLQQIAMLSTRKLWTETPEHLSVPTQQKSLSGYLSLRFGEGVPRTVLSAKFTGMKSLEQLWWENQQLSPATRDPIVQKILEKQPGEPEYEKLVEKVEDRLNKLRSWRLSVKYPTTTTKENRWFISYAERLNDYIKHLAYDDMEVIVPTSTESRRGLLNVWLNLRTNDKTFDILMARPEEVVKILETRIPFVLQYGLPAYSLTTSMIPNKRGVCVVEDKVIKTFDRHVYRLPNSISPLCEKAIVVDCSDHDALAVTVRQRPQSLKQTVKVVLNGHIIELYPSKYNPTVTLDSRPIELDSSITLRKQISYFGQRHIELYRDQDKIVLRVPSIGLKVKAVSHKLYIEVSRYFNSRLCGLCGNYDNSIKDELMDPMLYTHEEPSSFAVSYLLPSSQCDVEQYRSLYKPTISSCRLQYKHDIITVNEQTCISLKPLPTCRYPCEKKDTLPQQTKYYCAPSEDQSTKDLVSLARIQTLHTLSEKPNDERLIYLPTSCKPKL